MTPPINTTATSKEALLALADRCEAAEGADAALDRDIWLAAIAAPHERALVMAGRELHGSKEAAFRIDYMADGARYSASLDAAMTLVPECPMTGGQRWAVQLDSGFYGATAELWHECSLDKHHGHAPGSHEALPRALCAAALRARASL